MSEDMVSRDHAQTAGVGLDGWRPIETAPMDGTRLLLKQETDGAYQGLVQAAGWSRHLGWVGAPVGFKPDRWEPLKP